MRLRKSAVWSVPLLFAYGINRFSHAFMFCCKSKAVYLHSPGLILIECWIALMQEKTEKILKQTLTFCCTSVVSRVGTLLHDISKAILNESISLFSSLRMLLWIDKKIKGIVNWDALIHNMWYICQSSFQTFYSETNVQQHFLKLDGQNIFIIGIKHDFPFINICKVPREVLKTEGEVRGFQHLPRDLANVNEWLNHVWLLLLHKSSENTAKMEKIIAHFILQPYLSLALFTYSHMLFINMIDSPWSGSHDWFEGLAYALRVNKVAKPCINSTWTALLINGFLSFKSWLLNTCGTNINAIIKVYACPCFCFRSTSSTDSPASVHKRKSFLPTPNKSRTGSAGSIPSPW